MRNASATTAPTSTGGQSEHTTLASVRSGVVGATGGQGVYLRHSPVLSDVWYALPDGAAVGILASRTEAQGVVWDEVRTDRGDIGWIPARFVLSTAAVTPTTATIAVSLSGGLRVATSATATPTVRPVSPTPTSTLPPSPTATPTPAFDFVVQTIRAQPVPGSRGVAYIRGRAVDRNGQLIPGVQFEIQSDGVPPWTATGPQRARADGTVTFPVTRGRFVVRVVGSRSEDAGWMETGQPGSAAMTDWEFVFHSTR